jgi:hypothetical protein
MTTTWPEVNVEGWKPLATLAREADVPEASARRYAETFSAFFRSRRIGKAMLYDPEAVDVLRAVSNAFGEGRRRPEVQELLAARFGQLHEVEPVRDEVVATRQEPTAPTSSADLAPAVQAFTVAVDRLASALERQNEIQARTLAAMETRLAALEAVRMPQEAPEPEIRPEGHADDKTAGKTPFWRSLLRIFGGGDRGE